MLGLINKFNKADFDLKELLPQAEILELISIANKLLVFS